VEPLVESNKGRRVQVGFIVRFYARQPVQEGPEAERREAAARVWEGLREIAQSFAPSEGSSARLEIEAPRLAAFLRPENEMHPEIALTARVFHGDDYFAEVTGDEREHLSAVTRRLTELGLKQGHW
jgi:hypothetical protein